jgi:protein TonB
LLATLKARLFGAMTFSVALHVFFLFGIALVLPDAYKTANFMQPLQVLLVNSKSASRPAQVDALAQHDLEGGGNTAENRQAKSPLPAIRENQQFTPEQTARRVTRLEEEYKQLLTQIKSGYNVAQPKPKEQQSDDAGSGDNLAQKTQEIARLEALIHKDWDTYQKFPKRAHFPSASTRGVVYAQYVEDWRIKVERIGNLNYPEAARREKIYGKLQLTVTILPNGNVESIEISRSSGHSILDAAAMRIVKLASPFPPLPQEILKEYKDGMTITRTWTFTPSDRLEGG